MIARTPLLAALAVILAAAAATAQPEAQAIRKNARVLPALGRLPDPLLADLTPYRAILFGEIHGTREAPRLALELARLMARGKGNSWLGLELPTSAQADLDRFRATGDANILKRMPFFRRPPEQQDGRSSAAMGSLLQVAQKVPNLPLYCLDTEEPDRDAGMAREFARHMAEHPGSVGVALVGNMHARVTQGAPWDPGYRPMGYNLSHGLVPATQVLGIDLAYQQGTAWSVADKNGRQVAALHPLLPPSQPIFATAVQWGGYFLKLPTITDGFGAVFFWRTLSASPPFVPPGAAPLPSPSTRPSSPS
ncbi:MAG: hypothetical protein JWM80_3500 [Cyanobacteria bacterium RYN_339]|nr:hypothetical protein [Cyanobacteria bacterium RYN_339]